MDLTVPQDLVYDDEPLDGILYGVDSHEATPADILELWRGRDELPPENLDAVMAILAQEPEKGCFLKSGQLESIMDYAVKSLAVKGENPRELVKLARICQAVGRAGDAELVYRQVLERNDEFCSLPREERWQAMYSLAGLLDQQGREAEASGERMLCEGEILLASDAGEGLIAVRSLACELYNAGRHEAAERLYRGLLSRRFQKSGTLVHLARVLLMQDRLPEARQAIAAAWKLVRSPGIRPTTPAYVLPRIIFFRILFAMLARGNFSRPVAALRLELSEKQCREIWTIEPVITHFKPYLHIGDVNFLKAIAEAINSAENMDRLNAFPVWTDCEKSMG